MAIIITEETIDNLALEINNGDLRALNEIIETWGFKDKISALRFAIAILKLTKPESLAQLKDNNFRPLIPTQDLLK